jgi:hypothetical protein
MIGVERARREADQDAQQGHVHGGQQQGADAGDPLWRMQDG